jgi:hypothetical protein
MGRVAALALWCVLLPEVNLENIDNKFYKIMRSNVRAHDHSGDIWRGCKSSPDYAAMAVENEESIFSACEEEYLTCI